MSVDPEHKWEDEAAAWPSVDIIIVVFNHGKHLPHLVESLIHLEYPTTRLRVHFVVNSTDPRDVRILEAEIGRWSSRMPKSTTTITEENLGFAGGNNLAIQKAIDDKRDFVYMLNPDTVIDPPAIRRSVEVALADTNTGAVQSLLLYMRRPTTVNSAGNAMHFLGFGYCGLSGESLSTVPDQPLRIGYASGAAVLVPCSVLQRVGMFDELLFAYHEDLDLGWRLRLAGYDMYLAPASRVYHDYEFHRTPTKMFLLERNRWIVLAKNYRVGTLALLLPMLLLIDCGLLALSVRQGWFLQKVRSYRDLLSLSTLLHISRERACVQAMRRRSDSEILRCMTCLMRTDVLARSVPLRVAESCWKLYFDFVKMIVCW